MCWCWSPCILSPFLGWPQQLDDFRQLYDPECWTLNLITVLDGISFFQVGKESEALPILISHYFFSRRNESHRELCRSREKKILLLWKLYNNSRRASIKTKMKICFYPLKRTFLMILTQPVMTLWSVGTFFLFNMNLENNWSYHTEDFEVFDERDLFKVIAYLTMSLGIIDPSFYLKKNTFILNWRHFRFRMTYSTFIPRIQVHHFYNFYKTDESSNLNLLWNSFFSIRQLQYWWDRPKPIRYRV